MHACRNTLCVHGLQNYISFQLSVVCMCLYAYLCIEKAFISYRPAAQTCNLCMLALRERAQFCWGEMILSVALTELNPGPAHAPHQSSPFCFPALFSLSFVSRARKWRGVRGSDVYSDVYCSYAYHAMLKMLSHLCHFTKTISPEPSDSILYIRLTKANFTSTQSYIARLLTGSGDFGQLDRNKASD